MGSTLTGQAAAHRSLEIITIILNFEIENCLVKALQEYLCSAPTAKLLMSTRSNIEIDYCPDCRGVWLDRGELDKLIELSGTNSNQVATQIQQIPQQQMPQPVPQSIPQYHQAPQQPQYKQMPQQIPQQHPNQAYSNQEYNHNNKHNPNYKHKKKEGWFGDMFDFD